MRSFGETLKVERQKLGLTQKQVADSIGMSDAYICSLESDKRPPPPYYTVAAIANALELDAEKLWKIAVKYREKYSREKSRRKTTSRKKNGQADNSPLQQSGEIAVPDALIEAFFNRTEIQMSALGLFQKQPKDMTREEKRVVYQAINSARKFILGGIDESDDSSAETKS